MPVLPDPAAEDPLWVRMGPFSHAILARWGGQGEDDVVCTVGPRPTYAERGYVGGPGRRAAFRDRAPEEPLVERGGRPTHQFDQALTPCWTRGADSLRRLVDRIGEELPVVGPTPDLATGFSEWAATAGDSGLFMPQRARARARAFLEARGRRSHGRAPLCVWTYPDGLLPAIVDVAAMGSAWQQLTQHRMGFMASKDLVQLCRHQPRRRRPDT